MKHTSMGCAASVATCKIAGRCYATPQYHDNIIELRLGDAGRELRIMKMFATEHPVDWMPFEIRMKGSSSNVSI